MLRRLALVIFPDFQLLDAAGPITAFEVAERYRPGSYDLVVMAPGGGNIRSSSGVAVAAAPLDDGPFDTVMIAGGNGTRTMPQLAAIVTWLRGVEVRRATSVCTGAYVLAEAGLLDGRRATTHWGRTDDFARRYPKVKLDADRIFIRDGEVWTSAGITAGIDLALALIADDLGEAVARATAQELVVYHRRPGGQSQFSALLDIERPDGRFASLLDWVRERLAEPLGVERLADQTGMSPRNFARAFRAETGITPAKAIEQLRLEAARNRVESTAESIDQVALLTGFQDPERMRRAFIRAFGQPPQALRRTAKAA